MTKYSLDIPKNVDKKGKLVVAEMGTRKLTVMKHERYWVSLTQASLV